MPDIPKRQIHIYSVGVTDGEKRIAQSLLNRKKITVDAENVDVFKKLTNLPNCERLECINLGLSELPALPVCQHLKCHFNELTQLTALQRCRTLNCSINAITELPALPICIELLCNNNELTELPALQRCEHLDCSDNQLTELPALPVCQKLQCSYNDLTELPALPQCETLDCSYNDLTELPVLPQCETLDCSWNQLTELPALLVVEELDCSYNQITVIPPLPNCPDPIIHHNAFLPIPHYQTNLAWWDSQQQRQVKQQLKKQLTQQQKKQIQRTDPISLQQFQSPALGSDFAIYDDSTLSNLPFKGMRGLNVTRNLPLKQAVQKYKTHQDQVKKAHMKKDIAKYVALLQMLQTYGLQDLFGNQQ